jgi:DNA-binding beta-propeller fold protein YncE
MTLHRTAARSGLLASLAAVLLLAACGGGVDGEDEHAHDSVSIDTAGRLAIAEANAMTLRIHDLDSASVEASHVMGSVPSAVYASPGGRYAVVMQRLQDRVQFVDGGIWQEDHGDHLHDYKQASRLTGFTVTGPRPTHYDVQAGVQAVVFMDGNASGTPAQNASARLLTDISIGAAGTVATLALDAPIHGLAEPVGSKLLAVARAADAADALPTHLVLYERAGSNYSLVRQVPTRCNGMHGSFSSGSSTLVGCQNGMLLVRHPTATTVSDGELLATALRVGTIAGHPRLPDQFLGIATEGVAPAPVTTRFYAVNAETGAVSEHVPQGWSVGRVRRAHGFDRTGQRFFVLDDQGTLIVAQRQAGTWLNLARVSGVIPAMPGSAPWPAIVANGAKNEVYITDPVARQLVVVDSLTGAVSARRDLGYVPSTLAWLGITR